MTSLVRTAVLVTGMSGTGKSRALEELARRGHHTVDTDRPGWSEEVTRADGGVEQLWREEAIARLLDQHRDGWLFVAGCVANQGRFYDRFAAVALLTVPQEVMLARLLTRASNPFGRSADERQRILADLAAVETLLRATATQEIVTPLPPAEIADASRLSPAAVSRGARRHRSASAARRGLRP